MSITRIGAASILLVGALVVAAGFSVWTLADATGGGWLPPSRTVFVADIPGQQHIGFVFPHSANLPAAERRARDVVSRAGLPVGAVTVKNAGGLQDVQVGTSFGHHTGFFDWSVPGALVTRLTAFGGRRVVLEVIGGSHVVSPGAQPLPSDILVNRTSINAGSDIRFRIPLTSLLLPIGLLLALIFLPWVWVRTYARSVDRRDLEDSEKLHRLRRIGIFAGLAIVLVLPIAFAARLTIMPALLSWQFAPSLAANHALMSFTGVIVLVLSFLIPLISLSFGLQPTYRRIRGIERNRRETMRKSRRATALLIPATLPWIALLLAPSNGVVRAIVLLVVPIFLVLVGWPLIFLVALDTYPLEGSQQRHILDLCASSRVRVHDARAMRGRWQKAANAMLIGVIPRFRYIVMSDHLLDVLDPEETDAIVAHEIGHAKKHHLLLQLVSSVTAVTAIALLIGVVGHLIGLNSALIPLITPLLFVLCLAIVRGTLGLVFERKADDFAAQTIGADPMTRALEKLAEANQAKRDTGRVWNLLTLHPSFEQRIQHLRNHRGSPHELSSGRLGDSPA